MKPYIRSNSDYRKLELAKQGIVAAVADIENLEKGRDARRDTQNPRLKYEKGALCQADNVHEQWKSSGRFVWGLSSDGQKALFVGYVPQHEHGRYERTYDNLKRKAAEITDADFADAMEIESSEDIKRRLEEENAAVAATKKKDTNWMVDLQNSYASWQEECGAEPEMVKEGFEETVRAYLKEHSEIVDQTTGKITNREMGKLERNANVDPIFKQELTEICQKIKDEAKSVRENNLQNKNEEKIPGKPKPLSRDVLKKLIEKKGPNGG
jgi:hypothetical protein